MKLKDIIRDVPLLSFQGEEKAEIRGITYFSKETQPGYLFAALKGE